MEHHEETPKLKCQGKCANFIKEYICIFFIRLNIILRHYKNLLDICLSEIPKMSSFDILINKKSPSNILNPSHLL